MRVDKKNPELIREESFDSQVKNQVIQLLLKHNIKNNNFMKFMRQYPYFGKGPLLAKTMVKTFSSTK